MSLLTLGIYQVESRNATDYPTMDRMNNPPIPQQKSIGSKMSVMLNLRNHGLEGNKSEYWVKIIRGGQEGQAEKFFHD